MKNILIIGTGGTIASEMTPDGLTPELSPAQLLRYVPAIREHYEDYDGFVISHGTDTMAYTAAALSYLVQGADKPVMLTGAQKPINYDSTDSKLNLTDAFVCAASGQLAGVNIVFSGRVILGTHARKTCSKSFAAFSSINYPDVGILLDHQLVCYIPPEAFYAPRFFDTLDERVGLVKMVPGLDPKLLDYMLQRNDALILECFGVGGLPAYEDEELLRLVDKYTAAGKFIVVTTQVQNEGSDLSVYSVGHGLKQNPLVLEGYDMTSESLYAKMMWILGQTKEPKEVSKLFYTPVAHDILRCP